MISDSPSKTPGLLIDRLVSNPYLVTSRITKQLGLSFVTAQRSVDYLAEKSIIEEISDRKWNRVYYSTEILGILEGPFTNEGLIAR